MFSKIVLVCFLAAFVLADQDPQQLDKGEKQQQDTVVRRTVNKNIVDYTEKVQQNQPLWQQYRPVIGFTRDSQGIKKIVRLPGNPFFQEIRVNVKPYPGGYVAIRTNDAEIVKPFSTTPDATEKDEEIIIEPEIPENQQQQQILQQQQQQLLDQQLRQQEYKRSVPFFYPQQQQQYTNYLTRYPIWSRFLQPQYQQQQQQQQLYYQQEYPFGEYYRPYGQDIYNQEQGVYDRVVRDTTSKKDKKSRGDKQLEQQEKFDQEGLSRVPLYYQQYQRVPYQTYGKDIYDLEQQQFYPRFYPQQGPYTNPLLNRLLGYQQYPLYQQQYPLYQQQQYQPYNLPVYTI